MRVWACLLALMALTACGDAPSEDRTSTPGTIVDDAGFWGIVEDSRTRAGGDPEAMSEIVASRFSDADDAALRRFQTRLVEESGRLYTWPHAAAAEMICGYLSDDGFTDWRSWVISRGRETFDRVAEDPDNLADVPDLSGGCEAGGEFFGAAVSGVWHARHGFRDDFPILETDDAPQGEQLTDPAAVRALLPRLAARIPDDGLGQPPRQGSVDD